ncbi:MAG: hypothetical protein HY216_01750 [Candidatus Rokubacteria bacterium]|nr:hypothetical protein [Candidatus Rokubacteria bacterium]
MDRLTIGGATVAIANGRTSPGWSIEPFRRPFAGGEGDPLLSLRARPLGAPPVGSGVVVWESGNGWRVVETEGSLNLLFFKERQCRSLYRMYCIDRDWRSGTVHLAASRHARSFPLNHPVEQLVFMSLLGRAGGLVVHSTGVIHRGIGWVFAGTHGAGKSTLARLFRRDPEMTLLNDDRTVIRRVGGQWRVFGTPWSGTVQHASAESAPLEAIFLIRHGKRTRARRLTPDAAAARVVPRCLHPYWDRQAVEGLLATTGRLVCEIPCYDFPFTPHLASVLGALESVKFKLANSP